jgi:tetratricopeptide (TPR) repeat protein
LRFPSYRPAGETPALPGFLTHALHSAKIRNMGRALKLTFAASMSLSVFVWPARAQDKKTAPQPAPKVAPVVDPNAANYTDTPIYVPPGAVKSVEIGNFYLKKKDYKGALSRFKEALTENSTYAPAYLGLGKVYEKTGAKQKALDAYRKYLDALPSEKDAKDAKDVQRAVARLEREVNAQGPRKHARASKAESASPSSQ